MFLISLQKKLTLKTYTYLFIVLFGAYGYFSFNIINEYIFRMNLSIYEENFVRYFHLISVAFISLYIRYEIENFKKDTNTLKNKLSSLDIKISRILKLSSTVRKEKREIEKKLISQENESVRVRETIYEISNFNIEKIEKNTLEYFLRIVPSAKLSFYRFIDNEFKYKYSSFVKEEVSNISSGDLYEYIIKSKKHVSSIINYKNKFNEKVLIHLKLENEKFYGLVIIEEMDFYDLNKITIENLSYFSDLLSLQIQKSLVYNKQKETSFAYSDKDIYNLKFLNKIIEKEVAISNRYENISSSFLKISSPSFFDMSILEEEKLFTQMEEMLKKLFRTNDLLFYNDANSSFIFLLPMMKKGNIKYVEEKVKSFGIPYILSIESIYIDINSKLFEVKNKLDVK
jgi:hypothetical protein